MMEPRADIGQRKPPMWRTGDVVQLKSGGGHMVVFYVNLNDENSGAICAWWAGEHILQAELPACILKLAP
jgi:uncharacterized protein YodC (DUF2158 family)